MFQYPAHSAAHTTWSTTITRGVSVATLPRTFTSAPQGQHSISGSDAVSRPLTLPTEVWADFVSWWSYACVDSFFRRRQQGFGVFETRELALYDERLKKTAVDRFSWKYMIVKFLRRRQMMMMMVNKILTRPVIQEMGSMLGERAMKIVQVTKKTGF